MSSRSRQIITRHQQPAPIVFEGFSSDEDDDIMMHTPPPQRDWRQTTERMQGPTRIPTPRPRTPFTNAPRKSRGTSNRTSKEQRGLLKPGNKRQKTSKKRGPSNENSNGTLVATTASSKRRVQHSSTSESRGDPFVARRHPRNESDSTTTSTRLLQTNTTTGTTETTSNVHLKRRAAFTHNASIYDGDEGFY